MACLATIKQHAETIATIRQTVNQVHAQSLSEALKMQRIAISTFQQRANDRQRRLLLAVVPTLSDKDIGLIVDQGQVHEVLRNGRITLVSPTAVSVSFYWP